MTNRKYMESLDDREFARILAAVAGHEGNKEEVDFWEFWLQKEKVKGEVEALEQEPCTNCCNGNQIEKAKLCQKSYLAGMEHKQEPRTGHWIEIAQYSDAKHKIECSECGNHIIDRGHANSFNVKNKYKYCPNCGCRMESEDNG